MKVNTLQFAVVREDPRVELVLVDELLKQHTPLEVLSIASGGCTGMTLSALRRQVKVTLVDANPRQLEHVAQRLSAWARYAPNTVERFQAFGVGEDSPQSLSGGGNFESLFRAWRNFVHEFVCAPQDIEAVIAKALSPSVLTASKYWPVAFALFFSDSLLEAMFGPDATQHAPRGSYAGYFQRVVERGLAANDVSENWFLHHVLLGYYLPQALPLFLRETPGAAPTLLHSTLGQFPSYEPFRLISLSNVFDWTDAAGIEAVAQKLNRECQPGARLLIRQLNNTQNLEAAFHAFELDETSGRALLAQDRSLFYERILVATKRT